MKVNIDKTIHVSDLQRKQIAAHYDGTDELKRDATRDEVKQFLWSYGAYWDHQLPKAEAAADDEPGDDDAPLPGDDLSDLL